MPNYIRSELQILRNPRYSGDVKVIAAWKLGLLNQEEARVLYRRFKDAEEELVKLALDSFSVRSIVTEVEENAR